MTAHFRNRTLKAIWIGVNTDIGQRIGLAIKDFAVSYDQRAINLGDYSKLDENLGIDVVFFEVTSQADVTAFEKYVPNRRSDQRFVAVTKSNEAKLLRQLIRLGLSDWLTEESSEQEILEACHAPKVLNTAIGPRNVVLFTPVLGGMGATTLAIEAAIQLSRGGKEPTCVVDLDLYSGECADFLNIEAKLAIDSLAKNSDTIDQHLLETVLADHPSGIKLLAAKTHMGANQVINPSAVLHLLNLVSGMFTNVIIDMPRAWQAWTDDVILGSDAVFLISDGSVPALRAARRQLDEFLKRYSGKIKPRVIVNKHDRNWFSTSMKEKDLQSSLGEAFAGTVLDETKLAREAIDRGVPISTIKRNSTLIKDLHTIVKKYTR